MSRGPWDRPGGDDELIRRVREQVEQWRAAAQRHREQAADELRRVSDALAATPVGAGVPPARRHTGLRAALAEQLHAAAGWPLSTAQLRARVGPGLAGGGVYPALRALERAGLCVRVRDTSALASRAVYWATPTSPFADPGGGGDPR